MENIEKIKKTYTKADLIHKVSRSRRIRSQIVRDVYESIEEIVASVLSEANIGTDISVRLFEGVSISSTLLEEKEKLNNLTGGNIITASKIKPKAHVTRNYCEKLTNLAELDE